jgi:hypothetical protein
MSCGFGSILRNRRRRIYIRRFSINLTFVLIAFVAAVYPPAIRAIARLFRSRGTNASDVPAAGARQDQKQREQSRRTAAKDIPSRIMGEPTGEGVANLVRGRMGCVHPDDQQRDSDHQQDDSDNTLRIHDGLLLSEFLEFRPDKVPKKPERIRSDCLASWDQ